MRSRAERDRREKEKAAATFAKHEIRFALPGHWGISRKYPDGAWDGNSYMEILCLKHSRQVFVGGDFEPVVFAYGPADPDARLRWLGLGHDVDYYVAQKARIGSTDRCVSDFDPDLAIADLREILSDDPRRLETLEEFAYDGPTDSHDAFIHGLHGAFDGDLDWLDDNYDVGLTVSWRVYNAHAAMARLCVLLYESATHPTPGDSK